MVAVLIKKSAKETINEDETFAANFDKWYKRLDYFVSSCQACTDMYAEAFSLDRKIFLETGTPRNDIFFSEHPEIQKTCTGLLSYKRTNENFTFRAKFSDDRSGKRAVRFEIFIGNN